MVVFTEDFLRNTRVVLDEVQQFLGIPRFDFTPYMKTDTRNNTVSWFSISKASRTKYYQPMGAGVKAALTRYYTPHTADLFAYIGSNRMASLWA